MKNNNNNNTEELNSLILYYYYYYFGYHREQIFRSFRLFLSVSVSLWSNVNFIVRKRK